MGRTIAAAIFCSLIASTAYAMVFGGSNLGIFGYPKHTCTKPYKPFQFQSEYELENFKNEYSRSIDCIKEYVANADNDIKPISESANEAVDEANRRL